MGTPVPNWSINYSTIGLFESASRTASCQSFRSHYYTIASTDDATIRPQDHWQEKPRKSCSNLESCKCDQSRCVPARRLLTFELLPMKIFYVKYAARGCCKYLATLSVKNFAFYDSGPMAKWVALLNHSNKIVNRSTTLMITIMENI